MMAAGVSGAGFRGSRRMLMADDRIQLAKYGNGAAAAAAFEAALNTC